MGSELDKASLPKLAFLGPIGSHSYQCARNGFGSTVEYIEKDTIADVFDAVSPDIPFALIPQENSLFGTVTETYNLLRQPEAGQSRFVRGAIILSVRHSLLVREGVPLEDIRRVISHEQALGQCAKFLSTRLPDATLVNMPSTSAAAQALLSHDNEEDAVITAAICSSHCATVFEGLQVLCEDIQDADDNFTRFYVLASSLNAELALQRYPPSRALVRLSMKAPTASEEEDDGEEDMHSSRLGQLVMSTLLTTFGMPAARIDRRPSLTSQPFDDVYFVELEHKKRSHSPEPHFRYALEEVPWLSRVQKGVERVQTLGEEAALLGVW